MENKFVVLCDDDGKAYYFNHIKYSEELKKSAGKKGLSVYNYISNLSDSVNISFSALKKYGVDKQIKKEEDKNQIRRPSDINVCKKLGKEICQDENAFLILLVSQDEADFIKNKKLVIEEVFHDLYGILSLYDATECFNKLPEKDAYKKVPENSENREMAYFDMCIDEIEQKIDRSLLFECDDSDEYTSVKKRLKKITSQTRGFIHLYEQPGVDDDWAEANPEIRYYDPGFYLACYEPEAYRTVMESHYLKFRYMPANDKEISECKEYFRKLENENKKYNLRYSQEHLFQNELLETLASVFRANFSELVENRYQ